MKDVKKVKRKMKYKKEKQLTAEELKKCEWGDILWMDLFLNKGDGFKLRIAEPVIVVRHDEGEDCICMSIHTNCCDDICLHLDKYKNTDTLFLEEEDVSPPSRYKFYNTKKE